MDRPLAPIDSIADAQTLAQAIVSGASLSISIRTTSSSRRHI